MPTRFKLKVAAPSISLLMGLKTEAPYTLLAPKALAGFYLNPVIRILTFYLGFKVYWNAGIGEFIGFPKKEQKKNRKD